MASRIWKRIRGLVQNQIIISGSFAPQGTSDPVLTAGKGFTVSRTGVGLYTVTLQDHYTELVSAELGIRTADNTLAMVKAGDWSQANGTFDIRTYTDSGTAGETGTGFIALNKADARILTANEYDTLANHGGIITNDSTPYIEMFAPGSNQIARLVWPVGNTSKIAWSMPVPNDLDASADILLKAYAQLNGSTDSPTLDWECFFWGGGGTDGGGSTAALTLSLAELTVTVDSANVLGHPEGLTLTLAPTAHATDVVYLVSAWVEYTKTTDGSSRLTLADLSADADNIVNFTLYLRNSSVN